MTKTETLRLFLHHPYFIEQNIIREDQIDNIQFETDIEDNIVKILKKIIDKTDFSQQSTSTNIMTEIDNLNWGNNEN